MKIKDLFVLSEVEGPKSDRPKFKMRKANPFLMGFITPNSRAKLATGQAKCVISDKMGL